MKGRGEQNHYYEGLEEGMSHQEGEELRHTAPGMGSLQPEGPFGKPVERHASDWHGNCYCRLASCWQRVCALPLRAVDPIWIQGDSA